MKTGVLWNTYGGDIEWFRLSARSFRKYARGFDYAKCVVPNPHLHLFQPVCQEHAITLCGFDEWPGAGFNHHQAMQCRGDEHIPGADVIFHVDADCMFASPCQPSDWLPGGKPYMMFTDFKDILQYPVGRNEAADFINGRIQSPRGAYFWKWAAEHALGFDVPRETMGWMPIMHVPETYRKTREIVTSRHRNFDSFVCSCRNAWPQSFCEFNTLGAVAYKFFENRYHWVQPKVDGYPFAGKVVQCWSHGGFDRPHEFCREVGGRQTPRQMFQRLGLL